MRFMRGCGRKALKVVQHHGLFISFQKASQQAQPVNTRINPTVSINSLGTRKSQLVSEDKELQIINNLKEGTT